MQSYTILQGSASYPLVFLLVSSSDHISPLTGATATVTISKNGGAFASPAGAVTEIANGWYKVAGNGTDTGTLGPLLLHATATGADPTDCLYPVVAYNPQSATNLGLTNLDAAISTRSTYAGGDTAGTTTLLSRLTATRAGLLDNLDAAISTRSTYAGGDTSGTTTLLSRLTSTRATNLDNLDAAVSTRLATSGYTAPPSAASIVTTLFQDLTASADFTTVGSIGKLLVTNLDAAISSRSTYAGADTAGTTTLLARLTSTRATNLDNLDAAISTRLATSGYTAPLTLSQVLSAPRNVSAVADGSITLNDALWCAVAAAAGDESLVGTTYTVKTPAGTTIRVFTMDSGTNPTSRA